MDDRRDPQSPLECAYRWADKRPHAIHLTQPYRGALIREWTWRDMMIDVRRMAAHLKSRDLPPRSQIAIISKNCAWWMMADLAIWMAGHVSVPVYPTLPASDVRYILEDSETRLVFFGKLDHPDDIRAGIPEHLPIIHFPRAVTDGVADTDESWDAIMRRTEPLEGEPLPDPDAMATIIYTSGSTGRPKGVMHSHRGLVASGLGIMNQIDLHPTDRWLSYLPMSHSLERWSGEMGSLVAGYRLFFAESLDTFVQDLRRARPTLFISVPRLWQKFQLGVFHKLPEKRLAMLLRLPVVRDVIRRKVLEGLGLEAVRFAGSGSAPIPPPLLQWYRDLGLELLEGYGMTENMCLSHVNRPGRVLVGSVGEAYDGVECRLGDGGEILVKSPADMMGYWKLPEVTAESFTEDRFLRTGDVGTIDAMGRLRITGRVKEIFKTSKGKYIAPAKIENLLQTHEDVEAVCVAGAEQPQPFGMVMLGDDARARIADPAAKAELEASLRDHLARVNEQVAGFERLPFIVVVSESWTSENGFLTPTFKIKRRVLERVYGPLVDGWYAAGEPVVWQAPVRSDLVPVGEPKGKPAKGEAAA